MKAMGCVPWWGCLILHNHLDDFVENGFFRKRSNGEIKGSFEATAKQKQTSRGRRTYMCKGKFRWGK